MLAPADDLVTSLASRFLDAQLKGDRQRAIELVVDDGLGNGLSAREILLQVITPAQREVGQRWAAGEVSVADEHVATGISQLAMAHLRANVPPASRHRELLLLACVEGEWHDMGARVAADVLEHAGFQVRLVGPSVPAADLRNRIRAECPDVVLLSGTLPSNTPTLRATFARLRTEFPGLPVLVGGQAVPDQEAAAFCLPVLTVTQASICAEIERLLAA